jgi:TPM domain
VPAGDAFSARQQDEITRALRVAEHESGLNFSVYVGALRDGSTSTGGTAAPTPDESTGDAADSSFRQAAQRLHAALGGDAASSVLVVVDPASRHLEIVTGSAARRKLDDRDCALTAMSMVTAFSAGDLTGGIVDGVQKLAEHARQPRTLHLDSP